IFLQVHRGLPALRDADRLHAWIYQTTRRAIADHYRAPAHSREVPSGSADDLLPGAHAPATDGDERSALQELSTCLKPLMNTLGAPDQQALQLVEFEGLSQVEAARQLGLSISGMKSRVQRARLHLRSALNDCCRIALDRRGGVLDYEARGDSCSCAPVNPSGQAQKPD
ncbi:MAG: sigma-70 family RNA polymerase sigma factor, partial [Thermoanaerobaculia bacterium]